MSKLYLRAAVQTMAVDVQRTVVEHASSDLQLSFRRIANVVNPQLLCKRSRSQLVIV